MSVNRAYFAARVTLAPNVVNHLLTLLRVVDDLCPPTGREITIQMDQDAAANAGAIVLLGDGSVSASRCGYTLHAGESQTYRSNQGNVLLASLNAFSTAAAVLNIEVMNC